MTVVAEPSAFSTGPTPRPSQDLETAALVLTPEARAFVTDLVRRFRPDLEALLAARAARQQRIDRGEEQLAFLADTEALRAMDWKVAPIPLDLLQRKVEITGPAERKMIINALNSGADVFMADFEDSLAPTWENVIEGQRALSEAVRRTITLDDPVTGKHYALQGEPAVLMVRPRGLHLDEQHFTVDGKPAPACLFDFGLYFFHNARALLDRGTGAYFYLPKLQSRHEAAWWARVFDAAEHTVLRLPTKTIKATVLIETLPAAFEMDEILFALKDYAVGLNCGRWDYIFSTIKTLKDDPAHVMPDRALVTMTQPCMRAYTQLLIKTCHRRGAFAMGGMAAQIPVKGDPAKNDAALQKVRADKTREADDGHDGTWVAHPGLVAIAREVFDAKLQGQKNQLGVARNDVVLDAAALLAVPEGARTEDGLRHDVRVGVAYLAAWLSGQGCVPLFDLMEDAATAEIARAQVWQWLRHKAPLLMEDGSQRPLSIETIVRVADEEAALLPPTNTLEDAKDLFVELSTAQDFIEFLTLPAYARLTAR